MKKFFQAIWHGILWIWQLPQHLIAMFLLLVNCKNKEKKVYKGYDGTDITVYYCKHFMFDAGVSLGNYIFLDKGWLRINQKDLNDTVNHEHGHQFQSKYLGPLYLIVVGIISATRNLVDRHHYNCRWPHDKRMRWYYGGFPENWADKLGKVHRFDD